jgi:two-component system, response regulator PdtaR
MSKLQRQVLVVDDEFLIVMGLIDQIEELGLTVCGSASTADESVEIARLHRPAVVLMDMRLDGTKDGVDAARAITSEVGSKIIFVTGSQDPNTVARIRSVDPCAILAKPVSSQMLSDAIFSAIGRDAA